MENVNKSRCRSQTQIQPLTSRYQDLLVALFVLCVSRNYTRGKTKIQFDKTSWNTLAARNAIKCQLSIPVCTHPRTQTHAHHLFFVGLTLKNSQKVVQRRKWTIFFGNVEQQEVQGAAWIFGRWRSCVSIADHAACIMAAVGPALGIGMCFQRDSGTEWKCDSRVNHFQITPDNNRETNHLGIKWRPWFS